MPELENVTARQEDILAQALGFSRAEVRGCELLKVVAPRGVQKEA